MLTWRKISGNLGSEGKIKCPFLSSDQWRFLIYNSSPFCLYLNLRLILDSFLSNPTSSQLANPVTSTSKIHPESDNSGHLFHVHSSPGFWITTIASLWISLCSLASLKLSLHTAPGVGFLKHNSGYITYMLKALTITIKSKFLNNGLPGL